MAQENVPTGRRFLGIEGGATHSVALLTDEPGNLLKRATGGPANLQFLSDAQLVRHFRSFATQFPRPDGIAIGLAGAWAGTGKSRIRSAAARVWPGASCYATHDLETALVAAQAQEGDQTVPHVLVVSGTGSACYAKRRDGKEVKIGGWGHLLGDRGSGYDIGLRSLQTVIDSYDRHQQWPVLGQKILRALQLNEPYDLIGWVQRATKAEIAAVAIEVFQAREHNDRLAWQVLSQAAQSLALAAAACAQRIAHRNELVRFSLAGSVLLQQPAFARQVGLEIRRLWPKAASARLPRESAWGAVELARQAVAEASAAQPGSTAPIGAIGAATLSSARRAGVRDEVPLVRSAKMSPTEQRNPRSMNLDTLPLLEAIELFLSEDAKIPRKLLGMSSKISLVVEAIVRAFKRGGRLFYVGAGTSGRLGVLDASECPPTFRTPPELVQGIIAGGQAALWKSVEGAEDDSTAGSAAISSRTVHRRDVVIGIAASGTTPFVWGALREAKRRGATTVLLCFNPYLEIPRRLLPTIVLAPNLGPELLTGSTRLKAGTATKLLLNLLTTLAMVRLGKVRSNLMIDLNPANVKLRDRAVRIVIALTAAKYECARAALEARHWFIEKAVADLKRKSATRV
jgi:N-acetylmuramic acid 6-phosphate etherase